MERGPSAGLGCVPWAFLDFFIIFFTQWSLFNPSALSSELGQQQPSEFIFSQKAIHYELPAVQRDEPKKIKFCAYFELSMWQIRGHTYGMRGIAVEHQSLIGIHNYSILGFVLPN